MRNHHEKHWNKRHDSDSAYRERRKKNAEFKRRRDREVNRYAECEA